jgi:molybdopterin converting factor small subunit
MIGGASQVEVTADSVWTALTALTRQHPQLRPQLFNDRQEVNEALNVFVNDEHVRFRGGLASPLHDGDEVYIVPMIAGG